MAYGRFWPLLPHFAARQGYASPLRVLDRLCHLGTLGPSDGGSGGIILIHVSHAKKIASQNRQTEKTRRFSVLRCCIRAGEFHCPNNQVLRYRTTTREGYQEYVSDPVHCRQCELHGQCTTSRNCVKVVTRHIWQEYKEEINEHRYEDRGKQVYKHCKETVERSFADGKELHGHRVQMQYLLSAACQNMKKIALLVWRGLPDDGQRLAQRCLNIVSPWQRQIFPSALAA